MGLLRSDLIARILLEHDALAGNHREEFAVFLKALPLMLERLAHDFINIVLVGLKQRSDLERRMAAKICDVLARKRRMVLRLIRLRPQPSHYRNTVVPKNHETVVQVAHESR